MATSTTWGQTEQRRADILDAARSQLSEGGLAALNMREVARGAGVSPGTVYTYFRSKEELFATLYAQRIDEFRAEIEPACASARTPEQLFVTIATAYLDVYRVFGRELNIWAVLLAENPTAEDIAKPLIAAAERTIAAVAGTMARIANARGGTVTSEAAARLALPFLWATITGLADHVTSGRRRLHSSGWRELVEFTATTVVAGLDAGNSRTPQE
ncbi:MAG: TetR family transcriptional regulator [Actinophytocola sp.]|nr:TetR family transcriptional regulator [Actinophytocola sp.]